MAALATATDEAFSTELIAITRFGDRTQALHLWHSLGWLHLHPSALLGHPASEHWDFLDLQRRLSSEHPCRPPCIRYFA
jgi:hypothetical protein